MSLNDEIVKIQSMLDNASKELKSFEAGNKSAAARARKSLQSLKTASHTTRKSIMEKSKSMPKKTRKPKETKPTLTPVAETEPQPSPPEATEVLPQPPTLKTKRVRVSKPTKAKA